MCTAVSAVLARALFLPQNNLPNWPCRMQEALLCDLLQRHQYSAAAAAMQAAMQLANVRVPGFE